MTRGRSITAFAAAALLGVASVLAATDVELEEVPITASERHHWAYQPLADVVPPVAGASGEQHPIDAFLDRARAERSLKTLPAAGRATLLRRLSFDLTGLPPTTAEVEAFLAGNSADAYEKVVDRLLASPAYGERYAQHWLDLARFAESDGFEFDTVRPNAWRYRDWVIGALNRDLPYDQFLALQLAGDRFAPDDPQAAVATGFLLCGPDMPDINLQEERRHVVLNEMTATVGSVFLAMQFGCAQCHDHKFDPIRIQDFYRLRAFFESTDIFRDHPIPSREELAAREAAEAARDPKFSRAAARRDELESLGRQRFREKNPDVQPGMQQLLGELSKEERDQHRQSVETAKQAPPLPALPQGRVVRRGDAREAHVFLRGDFRRPGPVVACSFPTVLGDDEPADAIGDDPRVALARWLTQPDHPLTSRVIVNRLWQWHFGRGLVGTASDFGTMGDEPTHPELLDWLARRFVADGWSLKSMHRLIVTSRAYRMASGPYDAEWTEGEVAAAREIWKQSLAADAENKWWWRRDSQRLDGEAIRDAMLTACEKLSPRTGGQGIRPPLAPEVTATLLKNQWEPSGDEEDHRRRSVYLFVRRNLRYPMFDVFDRPDTNASCALRHESTTATQSLTQFNSAFSLQCAQWLAAAVLQGGHAPGEAAIEAAYLRVWNRPATADEVRLGFEFVETQAARLRDENRSRDSLALPEPTAAEMEPHRAAAFVDFCLALLNSNAFLYVD